MVLLIIYTISEHYSVTEIASILVHKIKRPQDQIDDFIEYVSGRKLKELGWEPEFNNFSDNIDLLINRSL